MNALVRILILILFVGAFIVYASMLIALLGNNSKRKGKSRKMKEKN